MKHVKVITLTIVLALLIGAAPVMAASAAAPAAGGVAPMLKLGPMANLANVPGPGYGLFSCQVGLSVGQCYDPYQMRTAYGVDRLIAAGYDGTGKTIVIVDAFQSPNIQQQLAYFSSFYGLPAGTLTQYAPDGLPTFDQNDPNMLGWAEEISLDVLWSHAIAPGAKIALVLGKSNSDEDLISALKYAVDKRLGDVVSMSFGEADGCLGADLTAAWHNVFVNATKQGMTLFASSGDQGALQPSCDGSSWIKSTSSPASDPLVVAVGGTELHAADYCLASLGCDPTKNPAAGTYQSEIAWNEGPAYGDYQDYFGSTLASGGGFSDVWNQPPYQSSTLPGGKQLGVPDVSYNGAVLHGVLTYLDIPGLPVGFYRFGGTSAGAPQWAAITAIADQKAGRSLGYINGALYRIGRAKPIYQATFFDVTSGTNSALEYDSSNNPVNVTGYNAGPGWDATTGFGSPKSDMLASNLGSYVSAGDATAALATTSHAKGSKPPVPAHVTPQ